ncbi:MarR family transcriptional regulator [soil metagenome]
MATTTYDYLLRRKADLESRMSEAQRRAQAPFEDELRALSLALSAIERGGLGKGDVAAEPASFAPTDSAAPPRRGRKGRSLRDMILLVLARGEAAIAAPEISRQLTRRWGREAPLATMTLELQGLEQEGLVGRSGRGWVRLEETHDAIAPRLEARA